MSPQATEGASRFLPRREGGATGDGGGVPFPPPEGEVSPQATEGAFSRHPWPGGGGRRGHSPTTRGPDSPLPGFAGTPPFGGRNGAHPVSSPGGGGVAAGDGGGVLPPPVARDIEAREEVGAAVEVHLTADV